MGLKSSQKRERQNAKRRARNRAYKSTARTQIRKAFLAMDEGNLEEAKTATHEAVKGVAETASTEDNPKEEELTPQEGEIKQVTNLLFMGMMVGLFMAWIIRMRSNNQSKH